MKIDCTSDLHGSFPSLEGGDLLIVAGDLTARDLPFEHKLFLEWLHKQPYDQIVYIAGNHDGMLKDVGNYICEGSVVYLCDDFFMYKGLKIYGTPWTPEFCNWHFMKTRDEMKGVCDLIPEDTDILVTHGPPFGILDSSVQAPWNKRRNLGCEHLRDAVERIKPALHVFGHIHGGYGIRSNYAPNGKVITSVNAAHMNEDYDPVNAPIRVVL